ncbi:MAG: hypothetical protein A2600_12125 [Candidatus Lambdaproteobacteria bacterium RIFOXYD1_FULL_56_27]|uniref:Gp5/Type VI secretion system Vgr protein OB-fold domain-containing protein n=1 Tax=Candidatus Lambdaproteobacteria bacterium RIFOXYD2_FULL_56_26 TaxID=1817773 RepID=A0A1F6GMM2_9PROT|nr:MAG: hypothetical protein A2557_00875 [Candidatus Lambdaproteobacteria bacterium RIFOXYD2_FULL_56_26]OGH09857.1 MAG: hypothetical protein A2600_12125 [Candidatus Lambdaproteobacteria bacterium RIFOXYD1_FULL_56_27]
MTIPPEKQFLGTYDGFVYAVNDPKGWGRVKVRVPGVLPEHKKAPWATVRRPPGMRFNEGAFLPLLVGDFVEVEFRGGGDSRFPHVVGSLTHAPSGLLDAPHDATGGPGSLDGLHNRPTQAEGYDPPQPTPYNTPALTLAGITFQITDGRLTLTHRKTGASWELSRGGNIDLQTSQNLFIRAGQKLTLRAGELVFALGEKLLLEAPELTYKAKTLTLDSAGGLSVKAKGLLGILGGTVQITSVGSLLIASQKTQEHKAVGSLKVNVTTDPTESALEFWKVACDAAGVPVASLGITTFGAIEAKNNLGSITLDATGLVEIKNSTQNLKSITGEVIALAESLANAALSMTVGTGVGPSSTPINSIDFAQVLLDATALRVKLALLLK